MAAATIFRYIEVPSTEGSDGGLVAMPYTKAREGKSFSVR